MSTIAARIPPALDVAGTAPVASRRAPSTAGLVGVAVGFACVHALLVAAPAAANWSAPAVLSACAAPSSPPLVAFPASSPFARTGLGAIAWSGASAPCGSGAPYSDRAAHAAGAGVELAPIEADDRPGAPRALPDPLAGGSPAAPAGLAGTCQGSLLLVGSTPTAAAEAAAGPGGVNAGPAGPNGAGSARPIVSEARAPGPFPIPTPLGDPGTPTALARAYLGDVAIASIAGGNVVLRSQRHFERALGPPRVIVARPGRVTALALALDYRTDALVLWQAGGTIFARELPESGDPGPIQRLGRGAPGASLQAVISDDYRAIVAWSETRASAHGLATTRIFTDISGLGVRFPSRPRLFARFADPPEAPAPAPAGALRLVRLSTETVLMAWTALSKGRYVVRAAPVGLGGVRPPTTVSTGPGDALLADLAPGPRGEALALWTSSQRVSGGPGVQERTILAARGRVVRGFRVAFEAPESIAPAGPNADPSVAYDPTSDRALAVWRSGSRRAQVRFSIRAAATVPEKAAGGHSSRAAASAPACPPLAAAPASKRPLLIIVLAACAATLALLLGGRRALRKALRSTSRAAAR